VYGHFRYDLDAIREVAEKAGLRYAEISGRRSDGLTDTSEMTPDADVVGVQIAAGGTGVDLTRSCWGIWYSKGHSLGNYDQALKRQDRPGQTRPVRFVHLEAEDTIDHEVYRSLMAHRAVVAGVLAQHGLNRPELGGDDSDEVPAEFDTVFSEGGSRGDNLAVRLPIDEFGHDVLGDPRPPQEPRLDQQTILELSLDDIL
jgi:SNF2 family DNA or RNA helicase